MFGGATQSWAHHSDLVMYARRVLGDRSDTAEDIVQEAYLRLLGLAASDEAPTSARPWLFRVVRNLAIDERRSVARRADPVAEPGILGTAAIDDTAALVEQREEITDAFRELAALPPRERRALEMDQAGIGAQTIAAELGTTPNAVHQALFRARRRLRNARAVAWGLIPIGLAPLALRLSDPALAVTITNLPPGAPIGRALPVAGLVAAAMVGGSAVAPHIDQTTIDARVPTVFTASAKSSNGPSATTAGSDSEVSASRGPSANAGSGTPSATSDGRGDRAGSVETSRGSDGGDGSDRHRGSGGSDTTTGSSDSHGDSPDPVDRHRGGTTTTTTTTTSSDAPDAPDVPDTPDAGSNNDGGSSGN